jgi:ParB family transcriptional regulator, chromosome partitioning protein
MKTTIKTPVSNTAEGPVRELDISIGDADPAKEGPASPASAPPVVVKLDPAEVYTGSGPNRLEQAFESEEFTKLSDSIMVTRGNLQPITVSPLPPDKAPAGTRYKYILIDGARRLRACVENRLPVLAVVGDAPGSLPLEVARSALNQLREPLCAMEFGRQLQVILQMHPHLSKRAVARIMGREEAQVMRAIDVAELPAAIVRCFPSPADIRYQDATPLKQAVASASEAVQAAAEEICKGPPLKASEVVKRLCDAAAAVAEGAAGKAAKKGDESFITLEVDGRQMGDLRQDKAGRQVITLEIALNDAQRQALNRQLQRFVREKILGQKKAKKSAKVGAAPGDAAPVPDAGGAAS